VGDPLLLIDTHTAFIATSLVLGATLVTADVPHRLNSDINTLW
jgi:hypothetical protein